MEINRQKVALGAMAVLALGGGAFYVFAPKKKDLGKPDLPGGAIYYTGPMKGKQGDYASDSFFPELGTENPKK
jgi:hypothetical protein